MNEMNRLRLLMVGVSGLVSLLPTYLGFPSPISYAQMYCGRHHTFCPYVSPWTFFANGLFDFVVFFVVLILITEFIIVLKVVHSPTTTTEIRSKGARKAESDS
jgi:hypothetical protein